MGAAASAKAAVGAALRGEAEAVAECERLRASERELRCEVGLLAAGLAREARLDAAAEGARDYAIKVALFFTSC